MMHGRGKSDSAIVAVKPTNKAERSAAEPVEPRAETKGNADQQSTCRAQNRISVSQALDCMRQALAVWTRGRSRMRESCTYGSVRGALSNERPYRDRRQFMTLLGGAAAWPLSAHAQQAAMPVIGFLSSATATEWTSYADGFRHGLSEGGYIEGRNVAVEYRWADNRLDRLPALAGELVRRQVAVIVAAGGSGPALAAKAATSTIPIVFVFGTDPVTSGVVTSHNRPGGNVTGVSFLHMELTAKRLELLHKLVPGAATIAILVNPERSDAEAVLSDLQEAGRRLGLALLFLHAGSERDLDAAFARLLQQQAGALSSVRTGSSTRRAINSPRSPRGMGFPRATTCATSRWPAA